jgi:hypothetical protein
MQHDLAEVLNIFQGLRPFLRQIQDADAEHNGSSRLPNTFKVLRWIEGQLEQVTVVLSAFMAGDEYVVQLMVGPPRIDTISACITSPIGYTEALETICTQMHTLLPR